MSSAYPPSASMPMRSCDYCGASLAHSLYCSKCGYYNFVTETEALVATQPVFSAVHRDIEEQPTDPLVSLSGLPGERFQSTPPALQETLTPLYNPPAIQSSSETSYRPDPHRTEQSLTSKIEPSSSYITQPTQIIPVVPRPKNKNKVLTLGIVISIIIVIGGGVGSYIFVHSPAVQKSAATTLSPQPAGVRKFADTFKDNSNQWNLQSEPGKYLVAIRDKSLILEDDNNTLLPELLPDSRSFEDFKLTVDATLSRSDVKNGYGLYIRCALDQNGNPVTYYRFELYGDGTYAIFKSVVDKNGKVSAIPLVSYTMDNVVQKQGSKNHIEIDAKGSTVIIRINGQELKTFSEPSYGKGTIALFVSNIQNASPGVQVKFSNLAITPDV